MLLLTSPASSSCSICHFPSTQLCNACNFSSTQGFSSTQLLQLRGLPQCPALTVHAISPKMSSAAHSSQQLPPAPPVKNFCSRVPQVRNIPWIAFPGTLEGGFPACYRGHISRNFHHEETQQLLYDPVSCALSKQGWTSVLWGWREACFSAGKLVAIPYIC